MGEKQIIININTLSIPEWFLINNPPPIIRLEPSNLKIGALRSIKIKAHKKKNRKFKSKIKPDKSNKIKCNNHHHQSG